MGGLTNRTYHVTLDGGKEYAIRIPGDGTEEMIVRDNERKSTELACELGIDAKLLLFDNDGSKVTEYISGAITMSADKMKEEKRIEQVTEIFKILHCCEKDTKIPFEVFDMARGYEKIITENSVNMYDDYDEIKKIVMDIKEEIDSLSVARKVPCHNDSLCENWIVDCNDRMYLIDWEYAGMNDYMWDLADISIEAKYNQSLDEILLTNYLGKVPTKTDWKHFLANKIFVDYLWTLWAKTRVPFDEEPQAMEDWAEERYARLKENVIIYQDI